MGMVEDDYWEKRVNRIWFESKDLRDRLEVFVGGEVTPELRLAAFLLTAHTAHIPILSGGVVIHAAPKRAVKLVRREAEEKRWEARGAEKYRKHLLYLEKGREGNERTIPADGGGDPDHHTTPKQ